MNNNIYKYIQNSMINNKICRFNKSDINIFVTQIYAPLPDFLKKEYYYIIEKAVSIWNKYSSVRFNITENQYSADIVILWTKAGIKFEGMCKFKSIVASEFKSITIEIGLPNEKSPKHIDANTILHTTLHELGHSLGLGHGVSEDDIMFVPHKKTLCCPSKNDIDVLNILYSYPCGTDFKIICNDLK